MKVMDCHALVVGEDLARYPYGEGVPPLKPGEMDGFTDVSALHEQIFRDDCAGGVLVQRGRNYGFDNALICDLAAENPKLRALCSVDMSRADCAEIARRTLARANVAGLRLMEPAKGCDLAWLSGENARNIWKIVADTGAIMDVHVFPWNRVDGLAALADLLQAFPQIPVLLDNLGGIGVENGAPDFGIDPLLEKIADYRQVTLKISEMTIGRLEKAGLESSAAVARIVSLVGAERLIWGSDILPSGMSLGDAGQRAVAATSGLKSQAQESVLYRNGQRLFGIDL